MTDGGGTDPMDIVWENRGDDVLTGLLPDGRRVTPPDVLKPGDIIVLPRSTVDPCSLYKIVEVDPDGAVGYDPYFGEGQGWDEIPNGDVIWNLQDRGMRLATDRERARGTADPSGAR